jgi:hypothetical protein
VCREEELGASEEPGMNGRAWNEWKSLELRMNERAWSERENLEQMEELGITGRSCIWEKRHLN